MLTAPEYTSPNIGGTKTLEQHAKVCDLVLHRQSSYPGITVLSPKGDARSSQAWLHRTDQLGEFFTTHRWSYRSVRNVK
jgi:hypothetical protein